MYIYIYMYTCECETILLNALEILKGGWVSGGGGDIFYETKKIYRCQDHNISFGICLPSVAGLCLPSVARLCLPNISGLCLPSIAKLCLPSEVSLICFSFGNDGLKM